MADPESFTGTYASDFRSLHYAMYGAQQAGLRTEFIAVTGDPREGLRSDAFLANGLRVSVHRLTNVHKRRERRQAYANTSLAREVVARDSFLCYHIVVPNRRQYLAVIPAGDLEIEYFGDSRPEEVSLYFPLVYRPDNPRFDFLAYEERWDLVARTARTRRAA